MKQLSKKIILYLIGCQYKTLKYSNCYFIALYDKRKRNAQKSESKYYKNEGLSLDDIDMQYAEVNTNRKRKNKDREPSSKRGRIGIKQNYFLMLYTRMRLITFEYYNYFGFFKNN